MEEETMNPNMKRKNRKGTFDGYRWRIKGNANRPDIAMNFDQLESHFHVKIGRTKAESQPYWHKWLDEMSASSEATKRQESPFQFRLQSLEAIIGSLTGEGRTELAAKYQALLKETLAIHESDIETADLPVHHPDLQEDVNLGELNTDNAFGVILRNAGVFKNKPKREKSILFHRDEFLTAYKTKKAKFSQYKTAIDFLLEVVGNIDITKLTVDEWRKFCRKLEEENERWGKSSKYGVWKKARTFVKNTLDAMNLPYGFLRVNDCCTFTDVEGQKLQYSMEQIKIALKEFTEPVERKILLLGLNAGLTGSNLVAGSITLHDGHLFDTRTKTKAKGIWACWAETAKVLDAKIEMADMQAFLRKTKTLGLPVQKALRATGAQWVTELENSDVGKLYRAEKGKGVHFNNYVDNGSEPMVARLDKALTTIEKRLFSVHESA
jgi:hypothetical protein